MSHQITCAAIRCRQAGFWKIKLAQLLLLNILIEAHFRKKKKKKLVGTAVVQGLCSPADLEAGHICLKAQ